MLLTKVECEGCGNMFVALSADETLCPRCTRVMATDPLLRTYTEYQSYMRARYGPGPWHSDRVRPEDRWREWSRRSQT